MVDERLRTGRAAAARAAAVVCAAAVLHGCGGSLTPHFESGRRLTPDDFHHPTSDTPPPSVPIAPYIPERPHAARVEIRSVTEAEAMGGVSGIDVAPGAPPTPGPEGAGATPPSRAGGLSSTDLVLVDAKVGDLNGWPVLARSWLDPMGARLRAESAGKTRDAWRTFAAEEIRKRLITDLRDELFLAEARSALTAEERVGLRVFLQRFEQDVVRSAYGSQTLAEEKMRASSGMGLVEAKRERERAALIENEVRTKVFDRVQVSSRDLRLEYERNFEKYNPPPQAVFRLIRVRSSEADTVEAVRAQLATKPFPEVADGEANLSKEPEIKKIPDGLEKAVLFGIPELQAAAAALSPGEQAGPIDTGTSTYWVYLEKIEDQTRSLYDVQLELRDEITASRREEEARRYLLRLFDRAGVSGIDDLTLRLLAIAERWYYAPGGG